MVFDRPLRPAVNDEGDGILSAGLPADGLENPGLYFFAVSAAECEFIWLGHLGQLHPLLVEARQTFHVGAVGSGAPKIGRSDDRILGEHEPRSRGIYGGSRNGDAAIVMLPHQLLRLAHGYIDAKDLL